MGLEPLGCDLEIGSGPVDVEGDVNEEGDEGVSFVDENGESGEDGSEIEADKVGDKFGRVIHPTGRHGQV